MYIARKNTAAVMALLGVTAAIAFLLRRGLKAECAVEVAPEMVWREADETDLF